MINLFMLDLLNLYTENFPEFCFWYIHVYAPKSYTTLFQLSSGNTSVRLSIKRFSKVGFHIIIYFKDDKKFYTYKNNRLVRLFGVE